MRTFEFHVIKKSEYDWPILKGKANDSVFVKFITVDSRDRYIFREDVMNLENWNKAAKRHNTRKGRKRWK